jgi:hypothetical protein
MAKYEFLVEDKKGLNDLVIEVTPSLDHDSADRLHGDPLLLTRIKIFGGHASAYRTQLRFAIPFGPGALRGSTHRRRSLRVAGDSPATCRQRGDPRFVPFADLTARAWGVRLA